MTTVEQIDYMIQSLKLAKDEIEYAEKCKNEKEACKDDWYYRNKRMPNGTIIRESLRMVGRLANIVANKVSLSCYNDEIFKE